LIYVLDSSCLIKMARELYPSAHFPTLWERLSELARGRRIRVPREVHAEVSKKHDESKRWLAKHRACVDDGTDPELQRVLVEIVNHPVHGKLLKPGRGRGDPEVVALARHLEGTVVTYERLKGSTGKPKIPDVCLELDVPCETMVGVIEREGWVF
jgi:hypothetical protein